MKCYIRILLFLTLFLLLPSKADSQSSKYKLTWQSKQTQVSSVLKNPAQNFLVASFYDPYSDQSTINILDASSGNFIRNLQSVSALSGTGLSDIAWNANGTRLAIAFEDSIDLWTFSGSNPHYLSSIYFTGRQPLLTWSTYDPNVLTPIWEEITQQADVQKLVAINTSNGTFEKKLSIPGLRKLLWSPDGNAIAALIISSEPDPITELIPSPEIDLLDPKTYQVINVIAFDNMPSYSFVWKADSSGLIGVEYPVSIDGQSVWQWDYQHPDGVRNFPIGVTPGNIRSAQLALNPSGNWLAISDELYPYVYVIDTKTGSLITTINGLVDPARALTWISDNSLVIASDRLRAFQLN